MPHAALWVVQRGFLHEKEKQKTVSMPHAALCVVQREVENLPPREDGFNAARGFVCGTAKCSIYGATRSCLFQCRTRLCGWCSLIARSPCPPRGKKPFWKVSGNLSVLTENM